VVAVKHVPAPETKVVGGRVRQIWHSTSGDESEETRTWPLLKVSSTEPHGVDRDMSEIGAVVQSVQMSCVEKTLIVE